MKNSFKSILSLVLVMVFIVSFVGCGSKIETKGQAESASIRIFWWGSEGRHNATLEAIKLFSEKYPNIKVNPEYQGYDGFHDKLKAQMAAKNEPDIYQFGNDEQMADFAGSGMLEDLAPFVGKEIDISTITQEALDWCSYQDVLYGIPTGINGNCLIYNKSIFDKAKVPYPTDDWSWEDFKNASEKITNALPDVYGCDEIDFYSSSIMIRQKGKLIADVSAQFTQFESELKDVYTQLNAWREEKVFPPLELSSVKNTQQDNLFLAGKTAMQFDFIAAVPMQQNALIEGEIGIAMVPGSNKQPSGVFQLAVMPWNIGKSSQFKKEAAQLINFLINDPEAAKILGTVRGVPASKIARDAIFPSLTDMDRMVFDAVERVGARSQEIDYFWATKGIGKVMDSINKEREQTGFGEKTPEQAAKDAYKSCTEQ